MPMADALRTNPSSRSVRRCRVLWVIKVLAPGGAERLLQTMAEAHDQTKIELHCAFLVRRDEAFVRELEAHGVRCHHVGAAKFFWPVALWQLIRTGHFDIVHIHSPLFGSIARLAAKAQRKASRPALVAT